MFNLSAPQECIVYGKQSFKDNPDLKDSRYKYVIISEAFNYTYLLGQGEYVLLKFQYRNLSKDSISSFSTNYETEILLLTRILIHVVLTDFT